VAARAQARRVTTDNLADAHCTPSRPEGRIADAELGSWAARVPLWSLERGGAEPRLARRFRFADFAQALGFANRIGAIADAEDHHPELTIEWGRVTVRWWTHACHGLHRNDFVMAAKTDRLAAEAR
jgi:4a-hydroxytetrahydrobiopterin dehydratase